MAANLGSPYAAVMRHQRSAFSLIELLVVVSIVAVLAGMLLPSISAVRAQARKLTCLNNQRQLMYAYFTYASDCDGLLPPGDVNPWWTVGYAGRSSLNNLLKLGYCDTGNWVISFGAGDLPLMNYPNPYCCPAVTPDQPTSKKYHYVPRAFTQYNGLPNEGNLFSGPVRLASLSQKMPYIAEAGSPLSPSFSSGIWSTYLTAGNDPLIRITHHGQAVVSYPDGHVEAQTDAQLRAENNIQATINLQ